MKNSINEFIKNLFREIFKSEEKTKFKIYILDVCVLCRLFDDQSYLRIRMEPKLLILILSKVKENLYHLIVSPVHIKK